MEGILLTSHPVLATLLANAGVLLFGTLLVVFGFALGLVFLLRAHAFTYQFLIAAYTVILCLLVAIVTLDLSGASATFYTYSATRLLSDVFSTHRWLLMPFPILATIMSLGVVCTYRQQLVESHAKTYLRVIQFATVMSFLSLLLIAFESLV